MVGRGFLQQLCSVSFLREKPNDETNPQKRIGAELEESSIPTLSLE